VIVERSMHDGFLSNTYLVADREGGTAAFVDAGGPVDPLVEAVQRLGVEPTHVLLTHHHYDHVAELGALTQRFPQLNVLAHPLEDRLIDGTTGLIEPGQARSLGDLDVRALHTPGHTAGMLAFVVDDASAGEAAVFTGDTLFRNSVGGVRAAGHTSYEDLKASIMDVLMELSPETDVYPGHTDATTVADEWEGNAFIRVWRGLDPEGEERCTALGEPATLVLLGDDYDGGHKAWVRWESNGRDDIVPGSKVRRVG